MIISSLLGLLSLCSSFSFIIELSISLPISEDNELFSFILLLFSLSLDFCELFSNLLDSFIFLIDLLNNKKFFEHNIILE